MTFTCIHMLQDHVSGSLVRVALDMNLQRMYMYRCRQNLTVKTCEFGGEQYSFKKFLVIIYTSCLQIVCMNQNPYIPRSEYMQLFDFIDLFFFSQMKIDYIVYNFILTEMEDRSSMPGGSGPPLDQTDCGISADPDIRVININQVQAIKYCPNEVE